MRTRIFTCRKKTAQKKSLENHWNQWILVIFIDFTHILLDWWPWASFVSTGRRLRNWSSLKPLLICTSNSMNMPCLKKNLRTRIFTCRKKLHKKIHLKTFEIIGFWWFSLILYLFDWVGGRERHLWALGGDSEIGVA